MVDFWVADRHLQVLVYTNCIICQPGGPTFIPPTRDTDTTALLWKTATGECPVGVLADRIEECYPESVELAELLRKGSGVGKSGQVLEGE